MRENEFQKEFLKVMDKFSRRYSKWQIWNDFLYLAAVSLANTVPVPERAEREKRYLEMINKYEKEYQMLFPELFAVMTLALDSNPEQDFLGTIYHMLNLHQEQKGQFFTPYDISCFMAKLQMADRDLESERNGKNYITVHDPACGAGALLIAFANEIKKQGINYQQEVLFVAQDIDMTAALMCYIQLSLLGCPAVIIIGDSLAKPGFHPDNQVWYTPFFYLHHWKFKSFFEDTEEEEKKADITVVCKEPEKIIEYMEEAGGQLMFTSLLAS